MEVSINTKRKFKTEASNPEYLYEVDVDVEHRGRVKTYRLTRGTQITVHYRNPDRPGLHKGNYTFFYAERVGDTLLIYADWRGLRRTIRESDIRTVMRRE